MTLTTTPVDNGINLQFLLDAREALSATPDAADFQWRARCSWVNGTHSHTVVEGFGGLGAEQAHQMAFHYDVDHPECFGSEDHGPTPTEMVLVGLAGCLTAGVAAVAQRRGIQLRSVTATLTGDMSVLGVLGADPDVRNGFQHVAVHFDIDADASPEEIAALVAGSQKRSAGLRHPHQPDAGRRHRQLTAMRTTTVVVGAGHAGLAMSRRLTERSVDHVVLERGDVANSWKTERWPGLRLLTPNRQTRLPGHSYDGADPDGYMTVPELIGFVEGYARSIAAPVHTGTTVVSVRAGGSGYTVVTTAGTWRCASVVVASGACNVPVVPDVATGVPPAVTMVTPASYRGPDRLPDGGVLVVGASATGVQLAHEIRGTGRPVTLAVGEHVRLPRLYRGRDILWWMDAAGILDQRYDEVDDIVRARNVPSPQLVGTPQRATLDLNRLTAAGVRLAGRLGAVSDGVALFSGALPNVCTLADLKLNRLLDTLDRWAAAAGLDGELPVPHRFEATRVGPPLLTLDLRRGEISTIIWACGYRPDHSWLHLPVFDRRGRIRHDGGVVSGAPGTYLLGTPFLRRRRSSFISGAEADTRDLGDHLLRFLHGAARARAG